MAQEISTNQKQTEHGTQLVTSQTIKWLFAKFVTMYGSKFTSQYPDNLLEAVQAEWLQRLNGYTIADIGNGLKNWENEWPPNIIEFRAKCKPATVPYHKEYHRKELPAPKSNKAGKEAMEKIKGMLSEAMTNK